MDLFINGSWQPSMSGEYQPVYNPADGSEIELVPMCNNEDVDLALQAAETAFLEWKETSIQKRASLQHKAAQAMRDQSQELGTLLCKELGRPLKGAIAEIVRASELLDYFAEEGVRLKGSLHHMDKDGEQVMVVQEPVGVVAAITPFNYPINLLVFKIGAALISGCTVVAKPAEDTPLSTLKLAETFNQCGYPNGVFNVITGHGSRIGPYLVGHRIVKKIAFTGGTTAGQKIGEIAAQSTKRVTLELGGHSPAIVCKDADLDTACPALVRHGFANSGQFCYRVNRIYVATEIYESFLEKMVSLTQELTVGNGLEDDCDLGPMVNEKIFSNSPKQVQDARKKGAEILCGGERLKDGIYDKGWYFPPTLISNATHDMLIMTEETFGPVLGIMPFDNLETAIQLANDSPYGLAGFIFSKNIADCLHLANSIDAGSLWINDIHRSYHNVPFGGMKQSGIGREKGVYGIEQYLEYKTIYLSYGGSLS